MTLKNPIIFTHFQRQADVCRDMGSQFTATLCSQLVDALDDSTKTGARIENWPGDPAHDALALRLCGGLHSIVISNPLDPLAAIYPDDKNPQFAKLLLSAIRIHDDVLHDWLEFPPQTNETGRAGALLPGLLHISRHCALPLDLREIGSSAGLNLQLDNFFMRFGDKNWGNPQSPVKLDPVMKGNPPDLFGNLNIESRLGCDRSPLDIADPHQQLRLRSYLWPDQLHRVRRLDGAIELAKNSPPQLLQMDAADFVETQLAARQHDRAFVLFHSVVWQYLAQDTKDRIKQALHRYGDKAGKSNPIYWLRLEGLGRREPFAGLVLDSWPDHAQILLANVCYHGSWIDFLPLRSGTTN